jgi:Asp-tRNA(Asn)/Glu-tRNA(Gln) amidotransferase A subunit family amidase
MPAGLQLVGPPFAEARVLQAAATAERVVGWDGKQPPILH